MTTTIKFARSRARQRDVGQGNTVSGGAPHRVEQHNVIINIDLRIGGGRTSEDAIRSLRRELRRVVDKYFPPV